MTVADKIQCSAEKTQFTLYKEGLFYKCYNEDAMVFSKCVKDYKISVKFVKSVGAKVMSLGFPVSEVENMKLDFESISEKIGAKSYELKDKNIAWACMN